MLNPIFTRLSLLLVLSTLAIASPADAQKKQKKNDDRDRKEEVRRDDGRWTRPDLQRRDRDDDDDDRWDDDERYGDRDDRRRSKDTPIGWCRGKGNPHNTAANCGYDRNDRRDRGGYDDYDRNRGGSYDRSHADFHHYLDRKYSDLARDRPLDPAYQIRIRRDRKAEHDRWHERAGRRHE